MPDRIHNIILSGDASRDLAGKLYRPDSTELKKTARRNKELADTILITATPAGYTAEIDDLDLSFMKYYET